MPSRRTAADARLLGDEIYERDIRQQVEDAYHGKIVAIDVDSGTMPLATPFPRRRSVCGSDCRTRMSGASEWDTGHYATSGDGPCGGGSRGWRSCSPTGRWGERFRRSEFSIGGACCF